jgi:hypothetical protein
MKQFLFIVFIVLPNLNIFSQNRINLLNNKFSFIKPFDVLMENEIPRFSHKEEARKYSQGWEFTLIIRIENEETFRKEDEFWLPEKIVSLLEKKTQISQSDYLALLDPATLYNLSRVHEPYIDESYSLFKYKNKNVGEMYAFASTEGSFFPTRYGFTLIVIVDTFIVEVILKLDDGTINIPKQLTEFFYYDESYKTYLWRQSSSETRARFYKQLVSGNNKNMPPNLKRLVEIWDSILASIEINSEM